MGAYYEATSVAHAISLLQRHSGPTTKIVAGGSDVLIQMREGKLAGYTLVSIQRLDELRGVYMDDDETLRILPVTSFSHITKHPLIKEYINVLGYAVDQIGSPQIRNIGTIGGNICNGVTSADSASTLLAYDAVVEITGPAGVRRLPITDFYIKAGVVALMPDEVLTAILIPKESYENTHGHYIKYAMRNAMDIATLGCSLNVRLSPDKRAVERVRVGYGVAGPVPMRAKNAEEAGNGRPASMDTVNRAAKAALLDVNPRDSWRASKALRLHLAEELCRRAFTMAITRAGGSL
jgi:xanthine dehydrogenase FAD-binding subunit